MSKTTLEVLEGTLALFQNAEAWTKGTYHDYKENAPAGLYHCLAGGLAYVRNGITTNISGNSYVYNVPKKEELEALGFSSSDQLYNWIDTPKRTIQEVQQRLQQGINKLKAEQVSHTKIPLTTIATVAATPIVAAAPKASGVRRWPKGHPKAGKFVPKDAVITSPSASTTQAEPTREKVIAYKGFAKRENGDLICRSTTFKIGQEQNISETPRLCERGFHACENPFAVFKYYGIQPNHVFGKVEILGPISRKGHYEQSFNDDKIAGKGIIVLEEFNWPHFINVLAKFARENPNDPIVKSYVSLNESKAASLRYDIDTTDTNIQVSTPNEYTIAQMSNVYGAQQIAYSYQTTQIACGANSTQIGRGYQISHGDANRTIQLGTSAVEVFGKNSSIVCHSRSRVKGIEGTRVSYLLYDTNAKPLAPFSFVIGEGKAEPNKWLRPEHRKEYTEILTLG